MKQWKTLTGTSALLLVLTGAAQAEVTAAEVWNSWRAQAEGMGQTVTTGSETQAGDTLTIRDLSMSMTADEVNIKGGLAMLALRDQGDGTVEITMSPSYDVKVDGTSEEGEPFEANFQISQRDARMIASGDDETISYEFSAPEIGASLASLMVNNKATETMFNLVATDVSGRYDMTEGEMSDVNSTLNASQVKVMVDAKKPTGDGVVKMNADFVNVAMSSEGTMAMMESMDDIAAMLAGGFATSADLSHGGSSYAIDFADEGETFIMNGKSDSGSLSLSLDSDAAAYDLSSKGLAFTMSGSGIPLPQIEASFDEFGLGFLLPLAKTDEPQDFGASVILDGLAVSDMIWSMFDPANALPHEPASFIVDVSGTGNWLVDILDPEATAELGEQIPAELHSFDLNDLTVAIAGAVLTGLGGFTFDNGDLETFAGIPAPDGAIDLELVGGNALLDKLVSMGLIPEDQAMGARMMLGLFARPGDGPDTLTSRIEIKPDGSITANGQRLQ